MIQKINEELDLGINAVSVMNTMIEYGIIHHNGSYNDEPIYSQKKATEPIHV